MILNPSGISFANSVSLPAIALGTAKVRSALPAGVTSHTFGLRETRNIPKGYVSYSDFEIIR